MTKLGKTVCSRCGVKLPFPIIIDETQCPNCSMLIKEVRKARLGNGRTAYGE